MCKFLVSRNVIEWTAPRFIVCFCFTLLLLIDASRGFVSSKIRLVEDHVV